MYEYALDQWRTHRWETDSRYYVARIFQDMFGTWLVDRIWGGRHNHISNSMSVVTASYEEAVTLLNAIHKRRVQRGYRKIAVL